MTITCVIGFSIQKISFKSVSSHRSCTTRGNVACMMPQHHRASQSLRWSASSIAVGDATSGSSFRSFTQRRSSRSKMYKRDGIVTEASIFGVGAPEAFVIGVVALLVFGPKGLAEAARGLGQTLKAFQPTIRELQEVSNEFKNTLESEIGLEEMKKELRTPLPKPAPIPPKLGTDDDVVTEEMKAQAAKAAWSGDVENAVPVASPPTPTTPTAPTATTTPTNPTAPTTPTTPTTPNAPTAPPSPTTSSTAASPAAAAATAASAAAAAAAAAASAATVVPTPEAPSTASPPTPTPVASSATPVSEPPKEQASAPPKADADSPPQGVPAAVDHGNNKSA